MPEYKDKSLSEKYTTLNWSAIEGAPDNIQLNTAIQLKSRILLLISYLKYISYAFHFATVSFHYSVFCFDLSDFDYRAFVDGLDE